MRSTSWAILLCLALSSCRTPSVPGAAAHQPLAFHLEAIQGGEPAPREAPRSREVRLPLSGVTLAVEPVPVFTGGEFAAVEVADRGLGKGLLFRMTPIAARAWGGMEEAHNGHRVVMMVDGMPLGVRRLDGGLADSGLFLLIEVPDSELEALAGRLRSSLRSRRTFFGK